jgi:Asp-tRNA(Asn)/Glu-tRNA(Gln) amidotransferase A subunit family amidase
MPVNSSFVSPVSLAALTENVRTGKQRLQDVINEACDRIELLDLQVRAVLPEAGRRDRLLAEAAQLADLYPDPESRPSLYGALVGVKDIISVNGFETRAGSALPAVEFEMPEASAITVCRNAGALILGKTVTTEFAMREPGSTTNPHDLGHTPGGSSSGSAAGLAAGYFPLSFGTQTIGSVLRPAAFCGVVGYKPSYERISRDGIVLYSRSVDHVGMFTADAASMRRAASVVCNGWEPERASAIDLNPDAMPTIGVTEGPYLDQASPEGIAAMEQALELMEAAGARIVRLQMFEDIEQIAARHRALIAAEFAEAHAERWPRYAWLYRPASATHVEEGQLVPAEIAEEARHSRLELRSRLTELMNEHELDLLASVPALGAAPRGLGATGDPAMNLPWTHSGLPAVTLPAGSNEQGLPLSIQLAARFEEDERLLAWAERL